MQHLNVQNAAALTQRGAGCHMMGRATDSRRWQQQQQQHLHLRSFGGAMVLVRAEAGGDGSSAKKQSHADRLRSELDRWRGRKQSPSAEAPAPQKKPASGVARYIDSEQSQRGSTGSGGNQQPTARPEQPVGAGSPSGAASAGVAPQSRNGSGNSAASAAAGKGWEPPVERRWTGGQQVLDGTGRPQQSSPAAGAAQSEGDVLLELRDVSKSFGSKDILRGASMKVRRGDAIGIIGGSGTGKSTTLRLMAGLLAPDRGQVLVNGIPRKGLASDDTSTSKALQIGMVFQSGALFDSLTVGENVGFLLYEHTSLPAARIRELVARSLAQVGLSGVEALLPSELSGGMKKRVALARAIIRDEEHDASEQVVMYDEPTAGLDPVASTVIEDLIRSLQTDKNAAARGGGISSYIVVTHQHSTIRRAVDSLIFLHEGSVVWTGSVEEFETTDVPIVAQFRTGSLRGPISYE